MKLWLVPGSGDAGIGSPTVRAWWALGGDELRVAQVEQMGGAIMSGIAVSGWPWRAIGAAVRVGPPLARNHTPQRPAREATCDHGAGHDNEHGAGHQAGYLRPFTRPARLGAGVTAPHRDGDGLRLHPATALRRDGHGRPGLFRSRRRCSRPRGVRPHAASSQSSRVRPMRKV